MHPNISGQHLETVIFKYILKREGTFKCHIQRLHAFPITNQRDHDQRKIRQNSIGYQLRSLHVKALTKSFVPSNQSIQSGK